MASQTITYNRGPNLLGNMLIVITLAVVVALFTLPAAKETVHAELHAEAQAIRQAYDAGCLAQRWTKIDMASGLQRDHCLVQLPDGTVGDRIVTWCKKLGWIEVTAFAIGDKTLIDAIEYLKKKGCQQVWP